MPNRLAAKMMKTAPMRRERDGALKLPDEQSATTTTFADIFFEFADRGEFKKSDISRQLRDHKLIESHRYLFGFKISRNLPSARRIL